MENNLLKLRKALGLSQSAVARKAELHAPTYNQIENGRLLPYASQLAKIAKALDWQGEPEELLAEVEK